MTQIVSSISGIEIYAPSAGNAPTNSSEVSAIASSYQVVSATSTQLYVGTAYLTGVNATPISASRAGNAANASMATSAYYDGTGRLISALPDSAAVSSIASSVASSYGSGKVDKSSISAESASWNSVYSTVATNSASWSGGGGGSVVSPSGTIFVNNGNEVESTNSAVSVAQTSVGTTSVLPKDGSLNAIGPVMTSLTTAPAPESGMTLVFMLDHAYYGADATVTISGRDTNWNLASASGLIVEGDTSGSIPLGEIMSQLSASATDWINLRYGQDFSAIKAPGYAVTGIGELAWNSALTGVSSTVANNSAAWGQGGVPASTVSSIASSYASSAASSKLDSSAFSAVSGSFLTAVPAGYATEAYVDSSVSGKQDTSAMSAYVPFSAISADENSAITSINGSSIGGGGVITATASGKVSYTGISSLNGSAIIAKALADPGHIIIGSSDAGMYLTGGSNGGTAYYKSNEMVINRSGYGETVKFNLGSAGSQVYGSASGDRGAFIQMSNDYHRAFLGALSGQDGIIELDGYSANSASMYAWDGVVGTVSSNSASWGQGGVDSATVSSIASSYAQDVSAAVSGTVDTVSSQSANWGGSALALSAGPGVKLELSGSTLVASTDETVLWSSTDGSSTTDTACTLSEAWTHFDHIDIWYRSTDGRIERASVNAGAPMSTFMLLSQNYNGTNWWMRPTRYNISDNAIAANVGAQYTFSDNGVTRSNTSINNYLYKVVGVNRTAGI